MATFRRSALILAMAPSGRRRLVTGLNAALAALRTPSLTRVSRSRPAVVSLTLKLIYAASSRSSRATPRPTTSPLCRLLSRTTAVGSTSLNAPRSNVSGPDGVRASSPQDSRRTRTVRPSSWGSLARRRRIPVRDDGGRGREQGSVRHGWAPQSVARWWGQSPGVGSDRMPGPARGLGPGPATLRPGGPRSRPASRRRWPGCRSCNGC